jgi:hypothetical protein
MGQFAGMTANGRGRSERKNKFGTLAMKARADCYTFCYTVPGFCRVSCAIGACGLRREGPLNRGFALWRGGRVAEGGGLLNRYTV